MNAARRRALGVTSVLGTALLGGLAWRPQSYIAESLAKVDLESMFQRQFADWQVDERVLAPIVSPDVEAKLNRIYTQTLSRTYVNGSGDRVMLSVAYGGDQSDATRAHRPEVCYPAQGFEVLKNQTAFLPLDAYSQLPVRQLFTRLGSRMEPVTYWIVVGDRVAVSGPQQKFLQLRYTTRGFIPDGLLVRVSNINPSPKLAYQLHERFVSDLYRSMPPDWRARVFGAHSNHI